MAQRTKSGPLAVFIGTILGFTCLVAGLALLGINQEEIPMLIIFFAGIAASTGILLLQNKKSNTPHT